VNFSGGTINFTERGSYYIHTLVKDNAGNEVIRTFGPYVINNSTPVANDTSVGVWEHEKNGNGANKVIIDLRGLVSDIDVSDTLTFTISQYPSSIFGTWAVTATPGVYEFTHSGYGAQPFDTQLFVKYYVTDNFGAQSLTKTVTINVSEVNDVPAVPTKIGPAASYYKDGDTVKLTWTAGADEETVQSDLVYEIQVSYNGGSTWQPGTIVTGSGATSYDYTVASSGIDTKMQFRIRTVDSHNTLPEERSEWVLSPIHTVDNTAPKATFTYKSEGKNYILNTNAVDNIELDFSFGDLGGSGLFEYGYVLNNSAVAPTNLSDYQMLTNPSGINEIIRAIDTYYLHVYAKDKAGNVYKETVGAFILANTNPHAVPQTVTVLEGEQITITLAGYDNDYLDYIDGYVIETLPAYGTFVNALDGNGNIIPNVYVYQHDGSETTSDSFMFSVFDSYGTKSANAQVKIIIIPVNDPPEILHLNPDYSFRENEKLTVVFDLFDPDNIPAELTVEINISDSDVIKRDNIHMTRKPNGEITLVFNPAHDTSTLPGAPIIITVTVTDPDGLAVTQQVEINVTPVNHPPIANDRYYTLLNNAKVSDRVFATDRDGDILTYTVVKDANNGTFTPAADFAVSGKFTYTPNPSCASDTVKILIDDGNSEFNTKEITLYFTAEIHDEEDHLIIVREIIFDQDITGKTKFNFKAVSGASTPKFISSSKVNVSISANVLTVTIEIPADAYGKGVLHLELIGGSQQFVKDIDVVVDAINDAPVVAPLNLKVSDGLNRSVNGVLKPNDSKDHMYAVTDFTFELSDNVLEQPEHGTVLMNTDGTFTYVPQDGYYGADSFYILVTEVGNDKAHNPAGAILPYGVMVADALDDLQVKVLVTVNMLTKKASNPAPSGGGKGTPDSSGGSPNNEASDDFIGYDEEVSGEEVIDAVIRTDDSKQESNNNADGSYEGTYLIAYNPPAPVGSDTIGQLENDKHTDTGLIDVLGKTFDPDGNAAKFGGNATLLRKIPLAESFLWLLLLLGLFIILLLVFRIKVRYIIDKGDDEKEVLKRNLFFRRLHYRSDMRLDVSYDKIEDLTNVVIVIFAGIGYRRRFYEKEMEVSFEKMFKTAEVPKKKVYKDDGIITVGKEFELRD
ncbi:MAG: Ig-like domain-containing protein, partial [Lachnospiraceae bacterium]|nr:Ig-like domain-containing protein [Lachnospiraceae bacterium]